MSRTSPASRTLVFRPLLAVMVVVCAGVVSQLPRGTSVAAGAPVLLGSGPRSAFTGTGDFTLTLWGYNIDATTIVRWDGIDLPTTVHGSSQASAPVTADMVDSDQVVQLTLHTPGEGTSDAILFSVAQGDYDSPGFERIGMSQIATNATVSFEIQGTGFGASTGLKVDGVDVPVRVISQSLLYSDPVQAPASPGTMVLQIVNRVPGGGQSVTRNLPVLVPPAEVAEMVTLGPSPLKAGSPAFTAGMYASGAWIGGTSVEIDGVPVPVRQRDSNNMLAEIPASMVANPGTLEVRMRGPGGALSEPMDLIVTSGPVNPPEFSNNSATLRVGGTDVELIFFASNAGPNAYVTWDGEPLFTTNHGSGFVTVSVPKELLAVPATAELILVNPPPHSASSPPITRSVYPHTDLDCDGDTDGDDVFIVTQAIVHLAQPPCFNANPDGLLGPLTIRDAVVVARAAAGLLP